MSDKGTIEQLRAELAQARRRLAIPDQLCGYCGYRYSAGTNEANFAVLTEHIKSCPRHPLAKVLAELAQARAELKDLQGANRALGQQVAYVTKNRDYWYETALAAEIERDQIRKEAEELRRQLAGMEAGRDYWRREWRRNNKRWEGVTADLLNTQERLPTLADANAALAGCGLGGFETQDELPNAIEGMAEHIKELSGQLSEAELAAHVLRESNFVLAQTVRTERARRRDVKRCAKQAEAELSGERRLRREAERRARELESSRDAWRDGRDSVTAELLKVRDWLEKAEQRAERAEALAALVTEKTAALLIRLGTAWTATLPDDGDIALELAARIREALGVNDA